MNWNNGTIFRTFVRCDNPTNDCKLDIGQQELNNKVFIGIENYVLKPNVEGIDDASTAFLQDFWAGTSYLQLESYQLPPYIDYTSNNIGTFDERNQNSRNTTIFGRLPLIASPTLGNSQYMVVTDMILIVNMKSQPKNPVKKQCLHRQFLQHLVLIHNFQYQ